MISNRRVLEYLMPLFTLIGVSTASTSCKVNGKTYSIDQVITRDVTIIGGGSAGTYLAIRLTDLGKSVAVIEQEDRLGGNTQTYTDPATGVTVEYGVQVFHQFPVVKNYFSRLNVSWTIIPIGEGISNVQAEYADFKTGQYQNFSGSDISTALVGWAAQTAQYPELDLGWYLPDPVPEDLLLPFGQFVTKYSLEALVLFTWGFTQGVGELLSKPTVYLMKYLGLSSLENIQTGYLTSALGDNSLLYLSAQKILGSNVFYNSIIISVQRDNKGVQVVIKQGSKLTLIKSSQLVIAIPPTLDKLAPFDTTSEETRLFKQWTSNEYFSALMRNTGIPKNVSVTNISPDAPYHLPSPPCIYNIGVTGVEGLVTVTYLSTTTTTGDTIPDTIIEQIKRVQVPGKGESDPTFAVYSNHRPFELSVDAEAIKRGFYSELYALQGKSRTWWTGAAWHAHDSSLIWRFTEGLLGNITAAL